MAVVPFMGDANPLVAQLLYSAVFFVVAFVVALNPDQLTNRLGKILTPVLLVLIVVIFAGCLFNPPGFYGTPAEEYTSTPFVKGFLDGYLTMDTIAALNFGIVISLNIKAMGMQKDSVVVKETIHAGFVAGGILLLVYAALAHVGATTGGTFGPASNGAQTLNQAVSFLYGKTGLIMLAVVFFIACLNTCIGLISCCSKYFCTIIPAIGYRTWAFIFALASFVISNVGLTRILKLSVPVLNAIYPVAIVLILLSFAFQNGKRWRMVYVSSIGITGVVSVLLSLEQAGAKILHQLLVKLPLYTIGLGWIVPALVGIFLGMVLAIGRKNREA
jgi:LIVCS family branched-chain amino acid:cation transporter